MELAQVIEQMRNGDRTEKTAEETKPTQDDGLKMALDQALDESITEKTAGEEETSALDGLKKIAAELAGTDKVAEEAQARVLGAVFAESFLSKIAAHDAELQKVAQQGYEDTVTALSAPVRLPSQEKTAAEQFVEGENAALEDVHKLASVEFLKGAAEVEVLLSRMQEAE